MASGDETRRLAACPHSPSASSFASSLGTRSSSSRKSAAQNQALRLVAFVAAVLTALCAGSVTGFSLYGHIFQERLHYTQLQVSGLAISSSVALYLPVSLLGYVCDRVGTAPLSALSAVLFGGGYGLAAVVFRRLDAEHARLGRHGGAPQEQWSYPLFLLAFVCIGVATCAMYLSAVATCAKNFGRGRHRGLALATPIAAFGLSGMWLSQVGSRWFGEPLPDGMTGGLDVFRFFVFLGVLLVVVGVAGMATLRVVGEDDLIDEAVEEMERSGLLDGSRAPGRSYGAVDQEAGLADSAGTEYDDDNGRWKKNWVLNAETRQFLTDRTMWLFATGFLLIIGPGEAFINNLGTVIGTLKTPGGPASSPCTSAATHVSIVGITSTIARLATGSLTDVLAPSPNTQHPQATATATTTTTTTPSPSPSRIRTGFSISRVAFLVSFALLLSAGLVFLASGAVQDHADRFWVVSGLIGAGYGAVFSLTPIIITIIWGVENFATNWGIVAMFPALGSTVWGLVYSAVYQSEASRQSGGTDDNLFCYGRQCYASTFWGMAVTVWVACLVVLAAWRGKDGWVRRGVVI